MALSKFLFPPRVAMMKIAASLPRGMYAPERIHVNWDTVLNIVRGSCLLSCLSIDTADLF